MRIVRDRPSTQPGLRPDLKAILGSASRSEMLADGSLGAELVRIARVATAAHRFEAGRVEPQVESECAGGRA